METPIRMDAWVRTLIAKQLAAIEATGWDSASQSRFLRLWLEQGIDDLEAAETEHYDYIAECIVLASENLQDARLHVLEKRVGRLEKPPFDLGKTILDAAFVLVGEMIIAAGAYYAVPAVFSMAMARRISRQRKRLHLQQMEHSGEAQDLIRTIEASIRRKHAEIAAIETELLTRTFGPGDFPRWLNLQRSKNAPVHHIREAEEKLKIARVALEESHHKAKDAIDTFDKAGAYDVKLQDEKVMRYMRGVMGSTVIGRVGETAGKPISAFGSGSLKGSGSQTAPSLETSDDVEKVFETSGVVGDVLDAIRDARRESREGWSRLRFHVGFLDDDQLFKSPVAQDLHALIEIFLFDREQAEGAPSGDGRSVFVRGFEALLWFHWFHHGKLLEVTRLDGFMLEGRPRLFPGDVMDGYVVEKSVTALRDQKGRLIASDPGHRIAGYEKQWVSGFHYPKARTLGEDLVKVLFHRFATPYFERHPDKVPEPMAKNVLDRGRFNSARYDGAWELPRKEYLFFESRDRTRLIDEVRVLVIEYFRRDSRRLLEDLGKAGAGDGAANGVRDLILEIIELPPGQPTPLQDALKALPPPGEGGEAPSLSKATVELEGLASMLATDGGLERKWLVGNARSQLEASVNNLDLKITAYQIRHAAATATSSSDRAIVDELSVIEEAQREVGRRHTAFLKLAEAEPTAAAGVDAQIGERIRALTSWSAGQAAEGEWKYYPPAGTPPVS